MSSENVELLQRAYGAWNRGDVRSAFELLDSDVEVSVPPNFPEAGTYRGRAAARDMTEEARRDFEDLRAEPQEFVEAGDRVVVFVRYYGRGRQSGLEVRGVAVDSHVWTIREGKAVKLDMYPGTREALDAVGLHDHPGPSSA